MICTLKPACCSTNAVVSPDTPHPTTITLDSWVDWILAMASIISGACLEFFFPEDLARLGIDAGHLQLRDIDQIVPKLAGPLVVEFWIAAGINLFKCPCLVGFGGVVVDFSQCRGPSDRPSAVGMQIHAADD